MDGLLVVNKPSGPTSHDVVARVRRVLRERRIGHTGTLDPTATGVLPLVIGRATRLARFLSSSDKVYETTLRLGFATDSGDAAGAALSAPFDGALPTRAAIDAALDAFRGTFAQQPPALSAKKIGGTRSYTLARQAARNRDKSQPAALPASALGPASPVVPAPVDVTAHAIDILGCTTDTVTLRVHCSAGFYIRSLAHDLGQRLGVGAHLIALCRISTGEITLERAVTLDALESTDGLRAALGALVPLERMLPAYPTALLTVDGVRHAGQGRDLGRPDFATGWPASTAAHVRLISPDGLFVGLAVPTSSGLLHPSVVLM